MQRLLTASEALVQRYTGRKFDPTPALDDQNEDTLPPVIKQFITDRRGWVRLPDLRELVSITYGGSTLVNTEWNAAYELWARDGEPATHLQVQPEYLYPGRVPLQVSGRWGFLPVPAEVKEATYRMTARAYAERDARYADQVMSGMGEGAMFNYFKQLPPTVKLALEQLRQTKMAIV